MPPFIIDDGPEAVMTVNQFALLLGEMGRATDSKEGIQPLQRNKFAGGGQSPLLILSC